MCAFVGARILIDGRKVWAEITRKLSGGGRITRLMKFFLGHVDTVSL